MDPLTQQQLLIQYRFIIKACKMTVLLHGTLKNKFGRQTKEGLFIALKPKFHSYIGSNKIRVQIPVNY